MFSAIRCAFTFARRGEWTLQSAPMQSGLDAGAHAGISRDRDSTRSHPAPQPQLALFEDWSCSREPSSFVYAPPLARTGCLAHVLDRSGRGLRRPVLHSPARGHTVAGRTSRAATRRTSTETNAAPAAEPPEHRLAKVAAPARRVSRTLGR